MSGQLNRVMSHWSTLTSKYSIYIILIIMIIVSSILSPVFFSASNFSNISRQISITTILAFGQTLLIICGLIDLAAGSVMALSGLVAVIAFKATNSVILAMFVGIIIGVGCNFIPRSDRPRRNRWSR